MLQRLADHTLPAFLLSPTAANQLPIENVDPDNSLHVVKRLSGKSVACPLMFDDKFNAWLQLAQTGALHVENLEEVHKVFQARKKNYFLDSIVIAFTPDEETEQLYQGLIDSFKWKNPSNCVLMSTGETVNKFLKITDPGLAEELGIRNEGKLTLYRYKDSRGLFHSKVPRAQYFARTDVREYIQQTLRQNYKVNGHLLQLQLQTYCDKYQLADEDNWKESKFKSLEDLANAISVVDPNIIPLWSVKDLHLILPALTIKMLQNNESQKFLIVSINQDSTEKDLSELPTLFQNLRLEEFAREHKDITVMVGFPQIIYHLPLREVAIYHYESLEIRLVTVKEQKVVENCIYDFESDLEEWLQKAQSVPESSPPSPEQNAEYLTAQGFEEKVLQNLDRCYFVMFGSGNCPGCMFQTPHFQEAAAKSEKCRFAKYNVYNQGKYFRPPGTTPSYHLYRRGEKEPIVYDARENGFFAEDFLRFIESNA